MSIGANCNECGGVLDVNFCIDNDGDGHCVVERCDCQDERIIDEWKDDEGEAFVYDFISEDPHTVVDNSAALESVMEGKVEEMREEVVREAIALAIEKTTSK